MKRIRTSLALLLLPVCILVLLWGCGGGSSPAGTGDRSAGSIQFTIKWPEPTRLIPVASNSIHIVITAGGQTVGDRLVPRPPTGQNTSSVTFNGLKPGAVTVVATAFPQVNGTGTAQATGTVGLTIVADQTVSSTLTMASTIDHVSITPSPAALIQGKGVTLAATAFNSANDVVLTSGSTWTWTTSDATVATVAPSGAQAVVTGLVQSQVTITARETESGKAAPITTTPLSRFIITDLGDLGGGVSTGNAINAAGAIAGDSGTSGFLWVAGTRTPVALGSFPSSADAINGAGVVAGTATDTFGRAHGFTWANGSTNDFGSTFDTSARTYAHGINNQSQVAGTIWPTGTTAQFPKRAVVFDLSATTIIDLASLVSNVDSEAYGINGTGQVVGYSGNGQTDTGGSAIRHAVLWQAGTVSDLGTLGGDNSFATALNASGMVVGASQISGGAARAFRTGANAPINASTDNLGVLTGDASSGAFGVNAAGQVVGFSSAGRTNRAFLWENGKMLDLVTQIPLNAGWTLGQARGINDAVQIVGTGVNPGGATHGFLLTPR